MENRTRLETLQKELKRLSDLLNEISDQEVRFQIQMSAVTVADEIRRLKAEIKEE